jgi:hypothetical protein
MSDHIFGRCDGHHEMVDLNKVAKGFPAQGVQSAGRVRIAPLKSIEAVKIRRSGGRDWMWRSAAGAG